MWADTAALCDLVTLCHPSPGRCFRVTDPSCLRMGTQVPTSSRSQDPAASSSPHLTGTSPPHCSPWGLRDPPEARAWLTLTHGPPPLASSLWVGPLALLAARTCEPQLGFCMGFTAKPSRSLETPASCSRALRGLATWPRASKGSRDLSWVLADPPGPEAGHAQQCSIIHGRGTATTGPSRPWDARKSHREAAQRPQSTLQLPLSLTDSVHRPTEEQQTPLLADIRRRPAGHLAWRE